MIFFYSFHDKSKTKFFFFFFFLNTFEELLLRVSISLPSKAII